MPHNLLAKIIRVIRVLALSARAIVRSPRNAFIQLELHLAQRPPAKLPSREPEPIPATLPNVVPVTFAIGRTRPPFLNVLVPGMALWAMSGGPNTAINLTYRLARDGLPVRYVSTDVAVEADVDQLWEHFATLTQIGERPPNVEIVSGHNRALATLIGDEDVFFGTAWWTVQMIKHAIGMTRHSRFLYLIQEFEPGLYPWSTVHALALETYGLDYHAIVNESVLMDHLVEQRIGRFEDASFAAESVVFEPAIDRQKFHPDFDRRRDRRLLLFYARPNAPRNLYELGLHALDRAAQDGVFAGDTWEIRFMGEEVPPVRLRDGTVVKPSPWLGYDAYADLLRDADAGIALMMSPHTGYPALELAAAGVSCVTTAFSTKTPERLRAISDNLIPVEPTLAAVSDGIATAVKRAPDIEARRFGADVAFPRDWSTALEPHLHRILELIDDCRRTAGTAAVGSGRTATGR